MYVSKLTEDASYDLTGVFTPEELKTNGLNVSGQEPSDGWVSIDKGTVIDYSLKFDEYVVNYDEETNSPTLEKNGDILENPLVGQSKTITESLVGTIQADGRKYLTEVQTVYFNPESGQKCNGNDVSSSFGTKTGCMKWYVYSVKDGYVNMILDHDITTSPWLTKNDFDNPPTGLGVSYPESVSSFMGKEYNFASNDIGPLTVLNCLKNNTSNWKTTVPSEYNYSINGSYPKYNIDYSTYSSRLITAQEIAYITGKTIEQWNELTSPSFGTLPDWLYENLTTNGYWTITATSSDPQNAWFVLYAPALSNWLSYGVSTEYGVRPVITVMAANVL